MNQYKKLGEWLVSNGRMTAEQRDFALKSPNVGKLRFGELVIQLGFCKESDVVDCLSSQFDLPVVELETRKSTPEALSMVAPGFALKHRILPLQVLDNVLECVVSDPLDLPATDKLASNLKMKLRLGIAGPESIMVAITARYSMPAPVKVLERAAAVLKTKVKIDPQEDRKVLLMAIEQGVLLSNPAAPFHSEQVKKAA